MFVVQALFPFSALVMKGQSNQSNNDNKQQGNQQQKQHRSNNQFQNNLTEENNIEISEKQIQQSKEQLKQKQNKTKYQQKEYGNQGQLSNEKNQNKGQQQTVQIQYLAFQKGQKILVIQAYQNGWWYGHTIKNPQVTGYFPSNYVQTVGQQAQKPKPPPPPPSQSAEQQQQQSELQVYDPNDENNVDWVKNQLKNINKGPVQSSYYLGIKGYKNVKIDQKNTNILKGDHVKFDVSTGLAKVPIKDQAPAAKAVRQMGYYFDYHQWCQQRNKQPNQKSRPDPKRKKIKKLNLKGMK